MTALHRITIELLHLLRAVAEDVSEERLSYRNELRRLTLSSVSLPFSEYEHFLERYGYWTLEHRTDSFTLSQAGELAARGDEQRLKSLDEDARYHFHKELEQLAPAAAPALSGQRFDQHYIRFDGVGRGGVGSVWRGEQLKTGRAVAIKTLEGLDELMTMGRKSTLKKKIERVLRAVARLDHPFVTPVLDLSVHHTPPYYVMPLCGGGSLRDLLAAGPIYPEFGLNIFAQVCLALEHTHAQGVLHLDLKPENILLDARGNAQVFDFGLSRVVGKQVALSGRQSYVGFGSVAYMAPELLRDPLVETPAVDIYSLGLILYEILVGELPGRRSPMPSAVIKALPAPIDELFDAMVQDSPQRRPRSMGEVLALLNQVPPFDRLSQQSMSILFSAPPVTLPGLKAVALPEPEVRPEVEVPPATEAGAEHGAERGAERAQPLPRLAARPAEVAVDIAERATVVALAPTPPAAAAPALPVAPTPPPT
ncbi:MAG: serine/threonine protein kinase, partial [Deltaproteobacteria bacterium]|nr:serine/threonine protein kinase [Deltaproteobacteria bacterium]